MKPLDRTQERNESVRVYPYLLVEGHSLDRSTLLFLDRHAGRTFLTPLSPLYFGKHIRHSRHSLGKDPQ